MISHHLLFIKAGNRYPSFIFHFSFAPLDIQHLITKPENKVRKGRNTLVESLKSSTVGTFTPPTYPFTPILKKTQRDSPKLEHFIRILVGLS